MINLKKFFRSNPYLLPVSKAEKEILKYFLANKTEFEQWLPDNPQQRIRFRFYFPTAIDFYFEEYKLFTAYFQKGATGMHELANLKMSRDNYTSIHQLNWKPFEEVMVNFLSTLEESNKVILLSKTKALYDYVSICEKKPLEKSRQSRYSQEMQASMAAG